MVKNPQFCNEKSAKIFKVVIQFFNPAGPWDQKKHYQPLTPSKSIKSEGNKSRKF